MMNILLSLLFTFFLFFGEKTDNKTDERVLAYIEVVQIGDDVYVRTTYDKTVFTDQCLAKRVVAYNYYKSCIDTPDIKTKKL